MNFPTVFPLGIIVLTDNARQVLETQGIAPNVLLQRYASADWSDCPEQDRHHNERALATGGRIACAYVVGGPIVWVITEEDRRRTTILIPSEYPSVLAH